jgi:hypothetical protein
MGFLMALIILAGGASVATGKIDTKGIFKPCDVKTECGHPNYK